MMFKLGKAYFWVRFPFGKCYYFLDIPISVYLGGFHGLQGFKVCNLWQPVPTCAAGLLPLKEDGRLHSCRFEGLGAWMPGGLEAGWLAGSQTGRLGLDWIGFEWLLDKR